MLKNKSLYYAVAISTAAITLPSCGKKEDHQEKKDAQQMPKTMVDVQTPVVKNLVVYNTFSGRTSASSSVEIILRVGGLLEKKHFTSGQYVKKGQLLFTIDQEQYQAAVSQAEAQLQKSDATVALKTAAWQKRKKVFERSRGVAEMDVLVADAERKVALSERKAQGNRSCNSLILNTNNVSRLK